jgi:hypothetical protein
MSMNSQSAQKVKSAALQKIETKTAAEQAAEAELEDGPQAHGIKDLMEIIVFVEALAETVIEAIADGISPLDVIGVFGDEELREAVGPAVRDVSDVPMEVTDLSAAEIKRLIDRLTSMAFTLYDTLTTSLLR